LKDLAASVEELFNITCHFKAEGELPPLEQNSVTQLYKITQEAATNAVRHGNARQVTIHLQHEPGQLVLSIRNNGTPFPDLIEPKKGMGLRIMNYRANVIGASFEIKPGRSSGATITCRLPLPGRASRTPAAAEKGA
jgi:signal transduction histidine kinase